ncbi:hypothetical protein OAU25_00365 [Crocinitomicaceae bacterium]|nr:hypothetical protein [Crocinitomicaceae bacterium]
MGQLIEINQGEVLVKFTSPTRGKITFKDLGITDDQLVLEGGFLRLRFDFEGIGTYDYFAVPTIEVSYKKNCSETHWQCEFNGETILDKTDHHGHSTVMLLSRKILMDLEHRHKNELIVHAEFPEGVNVIAEDSYINFFK